MKLFEFILGNFWVFIGFVIILGMVLDFILKFYNRTMRHWNIRKHGYPPPHCNADGDFIAEDDDN